MYGGSFFRALLCPAIVLSCLLSAVTLAAGAGGDNEQKPKQLLKRSGLEVGAVDAWDASHLEREVGDLYGEVDTAVAVSAESGASGEGQSPQTTEARCPVQEQDSDAIQQASRNGHVEMVRFLLEMKMAEPGLFGGIDRAAVDEN
jgi:hypothetical protein